MTNKLDRRHMQFIVMLTYPAHGGPSLAFVHFVLPLRSYTLLHREPTYISLPSQTRNYNTITLQRYSIHL